MLEQVQGIIATVKNFVSAAQTRQSDTSTAIGHAIANIGNDVNKWAAQGLAFGASPDAATYERWTKMAGVFIQSVKSIEQDSGNDSATLAKLYGLEATFFNIATNTLPSERRYMPGGSNDWSFKSGSIFTPSDKGSPWSWKTLALVAAVAGIASWYFLRPSQEIVVRGQD